MKQELGFLRRLVGLLWSKSSITLSLNIGETLIQRSHYSPRQVHSRNKFFLFAGHGSQLGIPFPSWQVWSMQVWRERNFAGLNYQTGPSLRLIISSEAVASSGRLQLNELGAIAECLAFRRTQKEYPYYPIIPAWSLPPFYYDKH